MKTLIKNIFLLLFVFILSQCGVEDPVELEEEISENNDAIEVELLSPDPSTFEYTNGYDSTGIYKIIPENLNIISVSGIKNTNSINTKHLGYYTAIFFDKTHPVMNHDSKLIGYRSYLGGRVLFNTDTAWVSLNRVRLRSMNGFIDSVLGFKHVLIKANSNNVFPYNSKLKFKLAKMNGSASFDIRTPTEITGEVNFLDAGSQENSRMKLRWNGIGSGKVEIIIGGIVKGQDRAFPLINLKTSDDGGLIIPDYILKHVPFNKISQLVVTFIRRKRTSFSNMNSLTDNLIVAQSIHNIRVRF